MKPWYVYVSLHCDFTKINHQQSELKKEDEEAKRRATAKKEAAAQKAEADFFALLKESGIAQPGAVWKEV